MLLITLESRCALSTLSKNIQRYIAIRISLIQTFSEYTYKTSFILIIVNRFD